MELIMYIVINKDLNMSSGKIAAQACHACTEYLLNTLQKDDNEEILKLNKWYADCQKKIILKADIKTLQKFSNMQHAFPVYDLGFTEVPPNSLTAVCLGIHDKAQVPSNIKRLRLL